MEQTNPEPIPGLLLPSGEITPGTRPASTLRVRNAKLACAFHLEGKRVLNLGCAWGLHSFYMAQSAGEVVGIDHSSARIATAEATRRALGISNVRFVCGDFRDPEVFGECPKFDLVIAWGFLHRISDIFALLHTLSPMSDALSLEWRTPIVPFMSKLSFAYHPTTEKALNPKNVGPPRIEVDSHSLDNLTDKDPDRGGAGFWEPTPGAVSVICRKFGFRHAQLLGYGESFDSGSRAVLRHWASYFTKWLTGRGGAQQVPLGRVHMIFEKTPGTINFQDPIRGPVRLPAWDKALQETLIKCSGR